MSYDVRTTDGVLADAGRSNEGLTESEAQASARERNARAEALGVPTRYEVVERS